MLLTTAMMSSCEKDSDNPQGRGPVITVTSPSANQTFQAGQSISVVASITHTATLHEVKLRVRNNANGNEILEFKTEPRSMTYDLSKSFTAQAGIVYKIRIEANDFSGVETEKEFTVSVN